MIVLCYHRISTKESVPTLGSTSDVSQAEFERHLRYLTKNFRLPRLSEPFDLSALLRKRARKPSVLLTFDDGYREMATVVLPLLLKYNVRGIFFLTTSALDGKTTLWFHRIEQALLKTKRFRNHRQRQRAFTAIMRSLRQRSEASLRRETAKVLETLGAPPKPSQAPLYLTWDLAEKLRRKGMAIGFHSHRHLPFEKLRDASLRKEFELGHSLFKSRLGISPLLLAYPFGRTENVNLRIQREAKGWGFRYAFTAMPGEASERSDPLALPRIGIHSARPWKSLTHSLWLARCGFFRNGSPA